MASTVRKVIQAIEKLSGSPAGLTAAELSTLTGMSWQAASRLLEALMEEGVVIRDEPSKKYQLSLYVCEWASSTIQGRTAISVARKECVRLALEIERRIDFLVLEGVYAVSVERCDPTDGLPLSRFVSARRLWYESASGRAILAYSPHHVRKAIMDRTYSEPSLSPPDREELELSIDEITRQGFAVTPPHPGYSTGIVVPVRDNSGFAIAAISTSFPAEDVEAEEGARVIEKMKACASRISHYLGFEDQVSTAVG